MMTSVFRLFATGLVSLLCHLPGAQAADRSAEYSASLAKARWEFDDKVGHRLTIKMPGQIELTAFRIGPDLVADIEPAYEPKGSAATGMGPNCTSLCPRLVINGGYFDRAADGALTPTGLLIANGKMIAPLTGCRACSGVLYTVKGKSGLEIGWAAGFKVTADITSAVQTGPLLVEPGGKLGIATPGGPLAERSAICLSAAKEVTVVAVTSRMTLYELATLLQSPAPSGFGCDVAINLDGGPSTHVAVRGLSNPETIIGSSSPVQNFVVFGLIVPPF